MEVLTNLEPEEGVVESIEAERDEDSLSTVPAEDVNKDKDQHIEVDEEESVEEYAEEHAGGDNLERGHEDEATAKVEEEEVQIVTPIHQEFKFKAQTSK